MARPERMGAKEGEGSGGGVGRRAFLKPWIGARVSLPACHTMLLYNICIGHYLFTLDSWLAHASDC